MTCYSLMDNPMTSCGCFMAIIALMPMCNGVMIVNREFPGMTPSGMKFSTLAGMVGGGVQAPGFMGIGRGYIASKKFMSAEGGLARVVWMPKELKEAMRGLAARRASTRWATRTSSTRSATRRSPRPRTRSSSSSRTVNHPALTMDPMF